MSKHPDRRSVSYARPTARFRPQCELLEDRCVPAGTVNAMFNPASGVLTLTASNDLADVNNLGTNNQSITLDGAGGTNFTVLANTSETGNAFTGGPFTGVKSIVLNMGLGNDTVIITDTKMTGSVTFNGGSGSNILDIDGAANFSGAAGATPGNVSLGKLTATNGDGFDQLLIGGGTNTITGSVTITNGLGGSQTNLGMQNGDITSLGSLKITNLDGFDTLDCNGDSVTITGAATISNGNGGSNTLLDTPNGIATTTVGGTLSITNLDGFDQFTTGGTQLTLGVLKISNGNGGSAQTFNANTNTIKGPASISSGVGQDDFLANGFQFEVFAPLTIQTGSGDSSTSFTPINGTQVDGLLTLTCGAGNDTLLTTGASAFLFSIKASFGSGDSTLRLASTAVSLSSISSGLSVTAGDGFDIVDFNGPDVVLNGSLTLNLGSGGSNVFLDSTTVGINGKTSITCGDGLDLIHFGGGSAGTAQLASVTIVTGNGGSSVVFDADTNSVSGSLTVTNGTGADQFDVNGSTFTVMGAVKISNGTGGSTTFIDASTTNTIGSLSFTATDGNDDLTLTGVTVNGTTSISTGNGNDQLQIDNSTFKGTFKVTAGAGSDNLLIELTTNDSKNTVFQAAVTIDAGSGDDTLQIGHDGNDCGDFHAAVKLTGGLDLDVINAIAIGVNQFAVLPVSETGWEQGT